MRAVRFKKAYAGTFEQGSRISYELVDDTIVIDFDDNQQMAFECYNTKLLGLIPSYMMEEADGSEIPAIDVVVNLSNQ